LNSIGPAPFFWCQNGNIGEGDFLTTNSDRRYFLLQNKTFASFGRQLVTEHTTVSKVTTTDLNEIKLFLCVFTAKKWHMFWHHGVLCNQLTPEARECFILKQKVSSIRIRCQKITFAYISILAPEKRSWSDVIQAILAWFWLD
jgi:hypothetical protein